VVTTVFKIECVPVGALVAAFVIVELVTTGTDTDAVLETIVDEDVKIDGTALVTVVVVVVILADDVDPIKVVTMDVGTAAVLEIVD